MTQVIFFFSTFDLEIVTLDTKLAAVAEQFLAKGKPPSQGSQIARVACISHACASPSSCGPIAAATRA